MATLDVVQFRIGGNNYALDIHLAREIVEMMPITPVPRSPPHIAGIINLRGEITNILNLGYLLGLNSTQDDSESRKIIVLVPETTGNSNIGIIVDDVQSVLQVDEEKIDQMDPSMSNESNVRGIIKMRDSDSSKNEEKLVMWIDLAKILNDVFINSGDSAFVS